MHILKAQAFLSLCMVGLLTADSDPLEEEKTISYKSLTIKKSAFGDLSMLVKERDDYATNLTQLALAEVKKEPSDPEKMGSARRWIALALHLSPRNRTAVVTNAQLGRGVMPESKPADYSRSVFARLLLTRGKLLKAQASEADQLVGSSFVALAAELDPKNEDAIYESEIQKLDDDEVDWTLFTTEVGE